jgi:hypothetical protein
VVSVCELIGARIAMAALSLRFGFDRGREKEGVKGERSGGWRRVLEGHHGLTGGTTAGIRPPWHAHAVVQACGRSATESTESLNRSRWTRLIGKI